MREIARRSFDFPPGLAPTADQAERLPKRLIIVPDPLVGDLDGYVADREIREIAKPVEAALEVAGSDSVGVRGFYRRLGRSSVTPEVTVPGAADGLYDHLNDSPSSRLTRVALWFVGKLPGIVKSEKEAESPTVKRMEDIDEGDTSMPNAHLPSELQSAAMNDVGLLIKRVAEKAEGEDTVVAVVDEVMAKEAAELADMPENIDFNNIEGDLPLTSRNVPLNLTSGEAVILRSITPVGFTLHHTVVVQ